MVCLIEHHALPLHLMKQRKPLLALCDHPIGRDDNKRCVQHLQRDPLLMHAMVDQHLMLRRLQKHVSPLLQKRPRQHNKRPLLLVAQYRANHLHRLSKAHFIGHNTATHLDHVFTMAHKVPFHLVPEAPLNTFDLMRFRIQSSLLKIRVKLADVKRVDGIRGLHRFQSINECITISCHKAQNLNSNQFFEKQKKLKKSKIKNQKSKIKNQKSK